MLEILQLASFFINLSYIKPVIISSVITVIQCLFSKIILNARMSVLDGIICRHFNVDIVDLTKFVLNILHIESISTHLQHELINWFYVIGIIWYLLT